MKQLRESVAAEFRAVRSLPWGKFEAGVSSLKVSFIALLLLYFVAVVVIVLLFPAALISNDSSHVLSYVVAAQLLVHLAWAILAWFCAVSLGVSFVSVLANRPIRVAVSAFGHSIARITTWTGRLSMPVLLGSVALWVLGQNTSLTGRDVEPGSILRRIALVQLGMLLFSLLCLISFEAVRVVHEAAEELPVSVRLGAAVMIPVGGWGLARHFRHFYPMVEQTFRSIVPATFSGIEKDVLVSEIRSVSFSGSIGLGVLIAASIAASLHILRARRVRMDSSELV